MKTILIVDDNKTNLVSAKTALHDIYKIIAVTSGAQALKYAESHTPDLVLLDINMPEMDGFEVMERLRNRENFQNVPIIFLTADVDSKTETKCLESGALDFITKPFSPSDIRSKIAHTLD